MSTLNVTVVVMLKLFIGASVGVASFGLLRAFGLVHRFGGAGGILSKPRFSVLGGVGRRAFPFSPFALPFVEQLMSFSMSSDLRFWVLNVLVLPMIPVWLASPGDMRIPVSPDSGLIRCCPMLVKLLRLDAVSEGVPARLWKPSVDGVEGLKICPAMTDCDVVTIFCWWIELKMVVPRPLVSVFDDAGVGLVFAVVGVVVGRGFAIG